MLWPAKSKNVQISWQKRTVKNGSQITQRPRFSNTKQAVKNITEKLGKVGRLKQLCDASACRESFIFLLYIRPVRCYLAYVADEAISVAL